MATPAQQRAINKFNKEKTTSFAFRFNNVNDADVIQFLRSLENKNGFIKELIRKEIKKDQSNK